MASVRFWFSVAGDLLGGRKRRKRRALQEHPQAYAVPRTVQILEESLELMETTVHAGTFICRYDTALDMAEFIVNNGLLFDGYLAVDELYCDLINKRDLFAMELVDRCREAGTLWKEKDEMLEDDILFTEESKAYLLGVLEEEEEACQVPADGKFIYCRVAFREDGKTYCYKTEDESLSCGDQVIVPVGNRGKTETAVIVSVDRYTTEEAPYPPAFTKDILGRANG